MRMFKEAKFKIRPLTATPYRRQATLNIRIGALAQYDKYQASLVGS